MKYYYDLHIHSCLSPCGDSEMTPNNIVNMSMLLGLDVIALTDHNCVLNCEAVSKLCKQNNICFLPGMELTTSEEIHVVCLFDKIEKAVKFYEHIKQTQMQIPNRADIYGQQIVMDENDSKVAELENLLFMSTDISVMDAKKLTEEYGGACFPAHIEKQSNSVISVLGDIPPECDFKAAEVYDKLKTEELKNKFPVLKNMFILSNSDSHSLEKMRERENYINLETLTPQNIISFLKNPNLN